MARLPETGYLRIADILGEDEITEAQAAENRRRNKEAEVRALAKGRVDRHGNAIYARRPTTPRRGKPAIIPVSKSTWWAGVKCNRYPKPYKSLGPRITVWRVEDIVALLQAIDRESGSPRAA